MKKTILILLATLLLPACAYSQSVTHKNRRVAESEPTRNQPGNKVTFKQLSPRIIKELGLRKEDLLLVVKADGSNILFFQEDRKEFHEGPYPLGRTLRGVVTILSTNAVKCKTLDIAGRTYWYPKGCE